MKRVNILCLGLLLLTQWQNLAADESSRYQIELLVFSQGAQEGSTSGETGSKIQWPTALTELSQALITENKTLLDASGNLFKLPGYQLISHLAWQQSTGLGGVILPMHIKSEDGRLDGYVQIRNVQVFELIVDLEYSSIKLSPSGKPYLVRVNEKRQTKLNEIHYFDNPNIGVLVKVSQR